MNTQRFHLGAVLSFTTGILMCKIDDVYRIAQHLTGEPIWTHQLGRVMDESKPHLLQQFPALAAATCEGVTPENFEQRLRDMVASYGEWFDVAPMPKDAHESIDPISELAEKVHPDRISVVTV